MLEWPQDQVQAYLDQSFPKYAAVERLGSGGFGDVWKVADRKGLLQEARALKLIPLDARGSARGGSTAASDVLARDWTNLTKRLEALDCPEMVSIYDLDRVDLKTGEDRASAVGLVLMECCPRNLHNFILAEHKTGADPERLRAALHRIAHVLKVLGDDKGFVFEDLKPENLLVREEEGTAPEIVAGDIGGLKAMSSASGQSGAQTTPLYTAPENLMGTKRPDQRSVVWGFGLIAFEVLEGGPPYEDEFSLAERNQRLVEEGPDWQAVTRKTFPDLVRVIERCLSQDPAARFEGGAALMAALESPATPGIRKTVPPATGPAPEGPAPGPDSRPAPDRETVGPRRPGPEPAEPAPSKPAPEPAAPAPAAGADGVAPTGHRAFETLQDAPFAPEMVVIPPGDFWMGSPDDDPEALDAEKPRHRVSIGYWLAVGKYAVTFDEFDRFVQDAGYEHKPKDQGCRGDRPVIRVSWEDAEAYLEWLNDKTAGVRDGPRYRLLTEAEWEYVARAGTETRYWWGNEITSDHANYDLNNWRTVPVGEYRPNPFGLYQVHGNVYEWVADCWHDDYEGAPTDGSAWLEANGGKCSSRVLRGGSWSVIPRDLRSASRFRYTADDRDDYLGFRVARTL